MVLWITLPISLCDQMYQDWQVNNHSFIPNVHGSSLTYCYKLVIGISLSWPKLIPLSGFHWTLSYFFHNFCSELWSKLSQWKTLKHIFPDSDDFEGDFNCTFIFPSFFTSSRLHLSPTSYFLSMTDWLTDWRSQCP
jgi:hypothetical protein